MSESIIETPVTPEPDFADLASYRSGQVEAPAETPKETPAETPAEAVAETPADTPAETPEPDPASEAGKALAKKRTSLQARIDEEVRRRGEAERRAAQLEAQLASVSASREAFAADERERRQAESIADPSDPEPTVDQFETYEKYVKAQARWEARQEVKAATAAIAAREQGRAIVSAQDRAYASLKAAHADADDVLGAFTEAGGQYSPLVSEFIIGHPDGHEVAYALAKDPELNARIGALQHPAMVAVELGRVLARIEAAAVVPEPVKPAPVVTKAPAPVTTVGGGAGAVASADPSTMSSIAEWRKVRDRY
jgi:hypothetical protein